jgi:hypothetical protein
MQTAGVEQESLTVDGVVQPDLVIVLVDDRMPHAVEVRLMKQ